MDYRLIDFDNHYYEPDDCFTRHIERKFRDRVMHVKRDADGTGAWFFGDTPFIYMPYAVDQVPSPGDMQAIYAGETGELKPMTFLDSNLAPFRERGARLKFMDEHDVQAVVLFSNLGVVAEHELHNDVAACFANYRAFNRWIEEDWGYNHEGRLFAPPHIPMLDVSMAVEELSRVLDLGARIINLRPGPIYGESPGETKFDPFWDLVNQSGVLVAYHAASSGYDTFFAAEWGEPAHMGVTQATPFHWHTCMGDRPIQDTVLSLTLRGVFQRFPNIKIISVENGSGWVKGLSKVDTMLKLRQFSHPDGAQTGDGLVGGSVMSTLLNNVFVSPFYEEDIKQLVDVIGSDRILFGSDWPHPEGLALPEDFAPAISQLDADSQKRIFRDNAEGLLGLA